MAGNVNENNAISEISNKFIWIDWMNTNRFFLKSESSELPFLEKDKEYTLEDIVSPKHQQRVVDYFESFSNGSSAIYFNILSPEKDIFAIECISIMSPTGLKSLWKINDSHKDQTVQLFATAAHDLRSPINSILGLTTVIQMILKEENPDMAELASMINLVKTSCGNALDFTGDLLELAEIESNRYHLQKEHVTVNAFISKFIDTHRLVTLKKSIKVTIESSLNAEETFYINTTKITRVLSNLLSNATKFSNKGGSIEISCKKTKNHIMIQMTDNGVGMSKDIIDNLFVKFGKSKRLGLDGEKSHGLGMSIVRQIMELHQGRIEIESEVGVGTKVSLIFKNK